MVDAMQRLNIDYHFQEEIEAFLGRQYVNCNVIKGGYGNDIHEIALSFRLLRQQGYFVPAEVFYTFTNKDGKFNPKLGENINGMIDLYEASQLGIPGEDILDEAGEFSCQILKEKRKSLCKAFLGEAKWFASGNLPSAEEYLKNGVVSSGVHIVMVHTFFLLGRGLTEENVQIIDSIPSIISSPAMILRLWDDLGNAKDENQQGNDGSYVNCLMMDQPNYTMRTARERVRSKISDAWKSLNQECLFGSHFHLAFTKASLNLARMVQLMYSYDDKHSLPV
ncbi:terpene synthase 13 [Spatholobus suberectus]|nr:terpene synthase 13 [Spatholobus suberectus]